MSAPFSLRGFFLILTSTWLLSGHSHAQQTPEQLAFYEAERYYAGGRAQEDRYEKGRIMAYAIGLYVKYLNSYSGSKNAPAARFHLGHARQTLGQVEEAKSTYRALIKRHKNGPYVGSAAHQLAYLARVEEDWEGAARYFGIASKNLFQENLRFNALTNQVKALLKIERKEDLFVALRSMIKTPNHPYRDWARIVLGMQYFEAEQFEVTIRTLAPLLDPEAKSSYRSEALFYTGLSSAELGLDDVAESHLRTILDMPVNHPTLTLEQRRSLSSNKARAQTSLMGLYFKKEDWHTVTDLYEKGDFGATGKIEARRCMRAGDAYVRLNQYQAARSAFRKVDRALPRTEMAFNASFKCLDCDYRLSHPGLPERVDIFFELYDDLFPNHPFMEVARFFQGESLFDRKAPEEAALAFNKVNRRKIEPAYQAELLFKHGWCLSESGQYDGATRSFGHFLADFPDDARKAEAHNKRGEAHFALGDYNSALRDFQVVLSLSTTPEQTAFALQGSGRVLKTEKKYQAMVAHYRRILSEFPDLPRDTTGNANYWIGWAFYKQNKFEDAPPYLRKARDLVPEFYSQPVGDLLILGSFKLRDKKKLDTALQEVFAVAPAKMVPSHILSWLGIQMYHDGQIEKAADYLERATDLQAPARTDTRVWRTLAKAQNRTTRFSKARRTAELLLTLEEDPKWLADAHLDLAEANLGVKKYEEAIEAAQKGLAINAPGAHVAGLHLVLGEVALMQGRWEDAKASLQKTITMVPDDPVLQPRALHGAALATEKMGDPNAANDFNNRLKKNFPQFQPVLKLNEPGEESQINED